jgi:hypothetical protein
VSQVGAESPYAGAGNRIVTGAWALHNPIILGNGSKATRASA